MALEWWGREILTRLENEAYWTAADVGADVWKSFDRRSASATAAQNLKVMAVAGLVEHANDGKKPLIWRRTPAGRAALDGGETS